MGSQRPHISYSSVMLFLANRYAWEMKYRKGIRTEGTGLPAAIGISFHKYMESACMGSTMTHAQLVENAVAYFDTINDIRFDENDDVENMKDSARRTIGHLCDYGREYLEGPMREQMLVVTETEREFLVRPKGIRMDIQGVMDAVGYVETGDGRLPIVIDWKSVKSFSDGLEPQHDVQASVYALAHKALYGSLPSAILFIQFKASKNRDGTPQWNVIQFLPSEKKAELSATKKLLNHVIREMGKKHTTYLPNLRDTYGAKESWSDYVNQLST